MFNIGQCWKKSVTKDNMKNSVALYSVVYSQSQHIFRFTVHMVDASQMSVDTFVSRAC